MFEPNQGKIPGYTGHQKVREETDIGNKNKAASKQIPGKIG